MAALLSDAASAKVSRVEQNRPKHDSQRAGGHQVAIEGSNKPPNVVAISRNMPMRMLEKPSFRNAAAAPEEVAMTETSEAPMA